MNSFLDAFFPLFKRNLAYAKFYKCLPFEWDEENKKIVVNKSPSRRISIRIWSILGVSYITFQLVNVVHGKYILTDKLVGALLLAIFNGCFWVRLEWEPDVTPIEDLNRLLFEQGMHIQTMQKVR